MQAKSFIIALLLTMAVTLFSFSAFAFTAIPQESGFSGFVQIGGGYIRGKTNMISSLDHNLAEIGQESIGSIDDSPNAESDGFPQLNFDLRYTFASTRTQVSFGNRLEDLLRFDFVTQAAARQEIGNSGIVGLGFLFTTVATKVWEDPYVDLNKSLYDVAVSFQQAFDKIIGAIHKPASVTRICSFSCTLERPF